MYVKEIDSICLNMNDSVEFKKKLNDLNDRVQKAADRL